MNTPSAILFSCVWLLSCLLVTGNHMPNFVAQDDLLGGQHEIRIHYNGVTAKQTSVGREQGSESGLVLRQIHQYHRLLTLVYIGQVSDDLSADGLSLRECKLTEDMQEIQQFLETFTSDADTAMDTPAGSWIGPLHNVTLVHLDDEIELPDYLRPIVHFKKLKSQCKKHLRDVKKGVRAQKKAQRNHLTIDTDSDTHERRKRWILNEFLIMPGTKWCGNDDLATSFRDLAGHVGADRCCRKHDLCPINIKSRQKKYGAYNSGPTTVSHCLCDERSKRSILSLRMPFTKWCGAHYDAKTYGDLGGLVRLDHCCRQHDMHCPFFIKFMEEKYGLRNYNIGTINHCGCDQRFKACLKLTRTSVADFVGDVFFNKMKTKCFDLVKKKVCTKRSGWFGIGPCMRYSVKQMAVLRNNVGYKY